jgi:CRP-like cAMP-binding protein
MLSNNIEDAIKNCPTLKNANIGELSKIGKLVHFDSGEIIIQDKSDEQNLYFIVEGIVSLYKLNMYGGKKAILILGPGKALNETVMSEKSASIFARSVTETTLLSFSKKSFKKYLLSDADTALNLIDSMSLKIRRLYHQLKNTCKSYHLDKQIASKLWKLGRDFGVPSSIDENTPCIKIDFKMSTISLAELMGTTRESTSRSLKVLFEKNLVCTKNGYFLIKDIEELRKYSLHPKID